MELLAFNHHANGVIFFHLNGMRHHGDTAPDHPLHPRQCVLIKNFLQTDGTGVVVKTVETRNFLDFFSLFL